MSQPQRFSTQSGIAIGPILFVIAILALLAAVVSSGGGGFQVAAGADRITADIVAQANLIRSTINECNMQYSIQMATNPGGTTPVSDPYPSPQGTVSPVSALYCSPIGSTISTPIWNDVSLGTKLLPPPTQGFNPWSYIDDSAAPNGNGRCFYTSPTEANPVNDLSLTSGLTRAAAKFNSSTSYSPTTEVIYNPTSANQKFIVWITMPTTGSGNINCITP